MLVGPSGCGKTTALRMIAGLEDITSGDLYIGGRRMNDVSEKDRDIAMVFQNYALYPHMTVAQNIGFSLKLQRTPRKRDPGAGAGDRSAARDRAAARPPPEAAQRRAAPAGRDGSRGDPPAAGLPDGRAALEPRRPAPRPHARRDRGAAEAAGRDDDVRHARPGRGDDDGRPRGRAPRRRAAAGRHADQDLRPAGEPVRRRVHRLAADEPRSGAIDRATAGSRSGSEISGSGSRPSSRRTRSLERGWGAR